jgi:hypothetical protein
MGKSIALGAKPNPYEQTNFWETGHRVIRSEYESVVLDKTYFKGVFKGASTSDGDVDAVLIPEESVKDAAVDVDIHLLRSLRDRIELFEFGDVIWQPIAEAINNQKAGFLLHRFAPKGYFGPFDYV